MRSVEPEDIRPGDHVGGLLVTEVTVGVIVDGPLPGDPSRWGVAVKLAADEQQYALSRTYDPETQEVLYDGPVEMTERTFPFFAKVEVE